MVFSISIIKKMLNFCLPNPALFTAMVSLLNLLVLASRSDLRTIGFRMAWIHVIYLECYVKRGKTQRLM